MLQHHALPTHVAPPSYPFPVIGTGSLPCQRPSLNPLAVGSWASGSIQTAPLLQGLPAPCAHTAIRLLHTASRRWRGRGRGRRGCGCGCGRWRRSRGCRTSCRWPHTTRLRDPCLVVSSTIVNRVALATPSPRSCPLDKPLSTRFAHKWAAAVSIACAGLLPIEGAEDTDHVVRYHV